MSYPEPPKNKSAVRRAGRAIHDGSATGADYALVDKWRASHGYVINTFQAWIKNHIGRQSYSVEFAQRLKRRRTVEDKLKRERADGSPLIADVTAMHDFAGCRMIFDDVEDLHHFRAHMRSVSVLRNVKHEPRNVEEKYDYIQMPKGSGYRGIHDVFKHFPRTHRGGVPTKRPWDGLLVELQYRTRAQHAWATAVEISDLLDGERTKFEIDELSQRGRFFALASEIISRRHEGIANGFEGVTTDSLQHELQKLENKLKIMQRLGALKQFELADRLDKHNVLNIYRNEGGESVLDVLPFKNATDAIELTSKLESDERSINAVYVRADNPYQLRSAYRNYFYDPVDFVKLLQEEAQLEEG